MPPVHPVLRDLPDYPIVRVERAKQALLDAGRRVFDLGTGDPLEPTPPFIREALRAGLADVCRYPTPRGTAALRQAAAGYLERRFGVRLDPDTQVISSRGSKEAIFHLPFAFLDLPAGKDTVVHPTPGYTVYASGTRFAGGRDVAVALRPENEFLIDPGALPGEVLDRLAILWVNHPHNPSGALAPPEYLARLAAFAAERDVVVCSDECYVDVWASERPQSLLQHGVKNVLALHSCSKRSGMTGYRAGFMAGDAELIATLSRLRPNLGVAGPAFVEAAAAAAWSDDAHVEERRQRFAAKRALFTAFFAEVGVETTGGDGTFFLWFRVPGGDAEAYCRRLLEAEAIVTIPGPYLGPGGEGFARVALVPSLAECEQAIERWRAFAEINGESFGCS